jgi:hypothetical protein
LSDCDCPVRTWVPLATKSTSSACSRTSSPPIRVRNAAEGHDEYAADYDAGD